MGLSLTRVCLKNTPKDNNHVPKYCERDVFISLGKISIDIAYNTACKARLYMMPYISDSGESHFLIKKIIKVHKCHRNIFDQDTKYLDELKVKIREYVSRIEIKKIYHKFKRRNYHQE